MGKKKIEIDCPEYNGLVIEIEAAQEEVKRRGKKAIGALFASFFAANPKVTAVGWTQYTPHFNDGEPCVFSVGEFYGTIKKGVNFDEVSGLYDGEESGFEDTYSLKGAVKAAVEGIARVADNDIFETAFGDHVMVIATPKGFHVSEYSHD